jgi:uncharacterized protein (DUF362 family)
MAESIHESAPRRPVSVIGVPQMSSPEVVEAAVRRAAETVTDFSWLSRGDRVLIKPVCNSPNPYPATTDPVAIHAMIRLLHEHGAGQITVADMSGVQFVRFSPGKQTGSSRELMTRSGMASAIDEAGAHLHAFEEPGWDAFHEESPTAGSRWSQPVMMPNILNETDHVVLMPRCARHILAGSTLGLKAAVGWWRHDSRLLYHREGASLPEKTAEANTVPSIIEKQRLVLTSATKVMTTFGPDTGYVVAPDTGLVIASASVVAHDMVSLAWLHENRRATPEHRRDKLTNDPHRSSLVRGVANRFVTSILGGGVGDVLRTETPPEGTTGNIWNDRFLKSGFDAFGGIPQLALIDEDGSVPASVMQSLNTALQPLAQAEA